MKKISTSLIEAERQKAENLKFSKTTSSGVQLDSLVLVVSTDTFASQDNGADQDKVEKNQSSEKLALKGKVEDVNEEEVDLDMDNIFNPIKMPEQSRTGSFFPASSQNKKMFEFFKRDERQLNLDRKTFTRITENKDASQNTSNPISSNGINNLYRERNLENLRHIPPGGSMSVWKGGSSGITKKMTSQVKDEDEDMPKEEPKLEKVVDEDTIQIERTVEAPGVSKLVIDEPSTNPRSE